MTKAFAVSAVAVAAALASPAQARTITGRVYVDTDGDGAFSAGTDTPVAGVTVALDTSSFAVTGEDGRYALSTSQAEGVVWARTPDGFEPGPPWHRVERSTRRVDLTLEPSPLVGPVSFVIASDAHLGRDEYGSDEGDEMDGADLGFALAQAVDLEPRPHFFTIVGDIVQNNEAARYDDVLAVERDLGVPFVAVPGNHDWFDGGLAYTAMLGPPMYSFDSGGARFVVLNDNGLVEDYRAFLSRDLADAGDRVVVAFIHRPPEDEILAALEAAGVDYLLTGHWHSNESFAYGDLIELSTEPIIRGGMDTTPAGYRIATRVDDRLVFLHGSVVERPHLEIAYPRATDCVDGESLTVVVTAHASATAPEVALSVDGAPEVTMAPAGGWAHVARVPLGLGPRHSIAVRTGDAKRAQQVFVCDRRPRGRTADWPQLQGSARHTGAAPTEIAPPLVTRWARAVGGHAHGGSPVVADGRVLVSTTNLGGPGGGAVSALDTATGELLWRFEAPTDIRSAPAVDGDTAVVATLDGELYALDAATGNPRWRVHVTDGLDQNVSALKAPPTVDNGVVYVGTQARVVAIDLRSGAEIWRAVPTPEHTTLTSYAAIAATDAVVVGAFGRGRGGVVAWDALTGERLWTLSRGESEGIHAAPVVGDGSVYLGNARGFLMAFDAATGARQWGRPLYDFSTSWDYALVGTPALHAGRLFVPGQYDRLFAVDANTGEIQWTIEAEPSLLHVSHARSTARAFSAAPVVAGDVLWVAGADQTLRAVVPATGLELWRTRLDSPITAGLAPAGDLLIAASYGGVVYALESAPAARPRSAGATRDAGGCRFGGAAAIALVLALVLAALLRGPRRRG